MQWLFPQRVWAFSRKKPNIYLTFDDGPIPEITPWVLKQLKKYNAKATFFCIGDNVKKHPEIFKQIIAQGHSIGNHTFHHLKGTGTTAEAYIKDVELCAEVFEDSGFRIYDSGVLFRPPYGKMTLTQAKRIEEKGYKIVMWDVLSADFDPTISKEKCLENVLKNIKSGSLIVFHDSLKAEKNLRYVLPKVLEFAANRRYNVECF